MMTQLKFPTSPRYDDNFVSPEELMVGYLIPNFDVWSLKEASTQPENADTIDGSDFLITKVGIELDLVTGTRHWAVELLNKSDQIRKFVSAKPVGEDKVEVRQSRNSVI